VTNPHTNSNPTPNPHQALQAKAPGSCRISLDDTEIREIDDAEPDDSAADCSDESGRG
jgi:hypothetical protein